MNAVLKQPTNTTLTIQLLTITSLQNFLCCPIKVSQGIAGIAVLKSQYNEKKIKTISLDMTNGRTNLFVSSSLGKNHNCPTHQRCCGQQVSDMASSCQRVLIQYHKVKLTDKTTDFPRTLLYCVVQTLSY